MPSSSEILVPRPPLQSRRRERRQRITRTTATVFLIATALNLIGSPQRSRTKHVAAARTPWQAELIDLVGPARVREAFNADMGRARVLLTFSPT